MIATGFLLMVLVGDQAMPVTEHIYNTEAECEFMLQHTKQLRPHAELECNTVFRSNS